MTELPRRQAAHGRADRDRRAGSAGAVAALVALVLCVGVAGLFGLFFPMASDTCADTDTRFICTAQGQQVAALAPVGGGVLGVVIVLCLWSRPGRWRTVGLGLGYLVAFIGFMTGWLIASAAP